MQNPISARVWGAALVAALLPTTAGVSRASDKPLLAKLQAFFDDGYLPGQKNLQAAQKHLAAARKLAAKDVRLSYAQGLVLLRQNQTRQAVAPLETALTHEGAAYWPAWQALIWAQLVDRQYDKGLDRLDEYARIVVEAPADNETDGPRAVAARWIGQMLTSLERSVEAKQLKQTIAGHEETIRKTLGEELKEAFETGQAIADERADDISAQAGDAAAKKASKLKNDVADKLADDLENIDKEKEKAAKSADETKKQFEDALAKIDSQLADLEKNYKSLEQRATAIDQAMTNIGREITALQLQGSGAGNNLDPISAQRNEQNLMQKQNQMLNAQIEFNATVGRLSQVAQQGRQAMQQRAALAKKFEAATGQIVKKNADLEKWTSRVNTKMKKLDTHAGGKAKGQKPAADRRTLTLRNFMPFDLDAERDSLLEAYGAPRPKVPQTPPGDAPVQKDDKTD